MPQRVDDDSGGKHSRHDVEQHEERKARAINTACPLDLNGKHYRGHAETANRQQAESLHTDTCDSGDLVLPRNLATPSLARCGFAGVAATLRKSSRRRMGR